MVIVSSIQWEFKVILYSQSPADIVRRQSSFHQLELGAEESTSSLMNQIFLHLCMFEYTLRLRYSIDLIDWMYLTFLNRSLFVQTCDKFLSTAIQNILETENSMCKLKVSDFSDFLH